MSERLEPQNFRKDGNLRFGEMGVPRRMLYDFEAKFPQFSYVIWGFRRIQNMSFNYEMDIGRFFVPPNRPLSLASMPRTTLINLVPTAITAAFKKCRTHEKKILLRLYLENL